MPPGQARQLARSVLAERRFEPTPAPRPLRGLLRVIAEPIDAALGFLDDALGAVGGAWLALAAVLLVAGVCAIVLSVRRPTRAGIERRTGSRAAQPDDPLELERRAERAERDGDLEAAIRLRFRAGLGRLERTGAIPARPSMVSSEVSRRLGSPAFDRLAAAFDEIAYGARRAGRADLQAAREGWAEVLQEAGSR
jgi:hypothetical protein